MFRKRVSLNRKKVVSYLKVEMIFCINWCEFSTSAKLGFMLSILKSQMFETISIWSPYPSSNSIFSFVILGNNEQKKGNHC